MARLLYGPVPVLDADGNLARDSTGGQVSEDQAGASVVTDIAVLPTGDPVGTASTGADGYCWYWGPDGRLTSLWVNFGSGAIEMFPGAAVNAAILAALAGGTIADGAITTAMLADANVTAAKLGAGSVTSDAIADDAVGTSEIAANAVTSDAIAADAVGTSEIAGGAVTPAELDRAYVEASFVNAKGDLIVATADNTVARLGVGTNGQVLTADSTQTSGVRWATASTSGVSEPDYIIRVDPTGSTSGDTAAAEAAWTEAAGASVAAYGAQSNRRGRVNIVYGAGRFTLDSDAPMMRALSTFPVAGLGFRGQGSDITEILFAPASGVDTACLFKNNNSWYNVEVEGMTLMSAFTGTPTATAGPAISEQTSTNPQAAAQNWKWRDVKVRGRWRYGNYMDGDNCNSEWQHDHLAFGTDAWFAEGWIFGDMSTDQGLNYDFYACQVLQLLGGKFMRMNKGGAIRFYGGQFLLDGGALAFDLRGNTHDGYGSTEQLLVSGARAEIRDGTTQMVYCEWGSGAVRFVDEYTDNVIPQSQSIFTFNPGSNRGPIVAFNGCYLTGRHEYRYNANKWQYPQQATYRDVRLPVEPQPFITNVFDTAAGSTDIPGGRVAAKFEGGLVVSGLTNPQRYRLEQSVNPESFAGRQRMQTARFRTSAGTTANGAAYAYLPINSEVVRLRFVKPAAGSSTATNWSLTLTDGDTTQLAQITGTSTSKQWQQAVNATVEVGAIATTDLQRQLTLTCANFPNTLAATAGYVEVDYVA